MQARLTSPDDTSSSRQSSPAILANPAPPQHGRIDVPRRGLLGDNAAMESFFQPAREETSWTAAAGTPESNCASPSSPGSNAPTTDADGTWLAVAVVPASTQERDTLPALDGGKAEWPSLREAILDNAFVAGRCQEWSNRHGMPGISRSESA